LARASSAAEATRALTSRRAAEMQATDVHRNVMQLLLGAGAVTEEDLLSKLGECIETHRDDAKRAKLKLVGDHDKEKAVLDGVVSVLNSQLDALAMKVAKVRSKHDKHVYYGLVNLRSDDFIKQGTNLDKGEQELFYKILEAIDACHDKDIEEMVAHNKRLDCQPRVSSEDATACLQQLEHGQWLHKSDDGVFSLGVRILLQRMYAGTESSGDA